MRRCLPPSRLIRAVAALTIVAAALVAPVVHAHEPDAEEIALESLVDAELAFARTAGERGVRAAFLDHFADDGIAFEPAPIRLRETWSTRPAPADPLALKLGWTPAQAGVARSHDMGYTTGPFTASRAGQPDQTRRGVFFSVWRRTGTGPWRVILDIGTTTPAAVDFAALGAAPRPHFTGRANVGAERRRLLGREANAATPGAPGLTPTAYAQLLAPDARMYRDTSAPIAARGAAAAAMAWRTSHVTWTPIDVRVSRAGDMAVSYGRYRETDHAAHVQDGYYAHLWLRGADGRWRLAYDIALPASS